MGTTKLGMYADHSDQQPASFDQILLKVRPDGILLTVNGVPYLKPITTSLAAHLMRDLVEWVDAQNAIKARPRYRVPYRALKT